MDTRTYIATAALQGLLANGGIEGFMNLAGALQGDKHVARLAVRFTDALLEELAK